MHRLMLVILCCTGQALGQIAPSPISRSAAHATIAPGTIPASITPADYATFENLEQVVVPDFALPDGRNVTLELKRANIFAANAELVVVDAEGERALAAPPLVLLRGEIAGEDSRVVLGITPTSVQGLVRADDTDYFVSSGNPQLGLPTLIFDPQDVAPEHLGTGTFSCHFDSLQQAQLQSTASAAGGTRSGTCRIADIALETDYEYRQLFASDGDATAYAATLMAALSEIFTADADLRFEISYFRLWTTSSDPWSTGNMNFRLVEFRDYWDLNMTGVSRHAAHLLSGQADDDGIAYGDAACLVGFDYGISSGLEGSFPYPLVDNDAGNWDPYITGHEFGHTFGNPHTHAIGIDNCANLDCSVTPNGTLMSYCGECPGGMTNIVLNFHPTMLANETLPFLTSGQCSLDANAPTFVDEPNNVSQCGGQDLVLSATWNTVGTTTAQWRKDGIDIPGATSGTYTVVGATAADSGSYDIIVTNPCGVLISAPVTVVICGVSTADVDGDCDVDLTDLATLLGNFGKSNNVGLPEGDLNADGVVDLTDLAEMLAEFGKGC